jgi:hypothetical protein
MSDNRLKMRHQKLLFELKFLYADLEYHETILDEAKREFQKEYIKCARDRGVYDILFPPLVEDSSQDPPISPLDSADRQSSSKEIKLLYRKIVLETHPDKIMSYSDDEKHRRGEIFDKASRASSGDNLYSLQQCALELGIELPAPSEDQLILFEREAVELRGQTGKMKATFTWNWNEAKSEQQRGLIMENYINLILEHMKK